MFIVVDFYMLVTKVMSSGAHHLFYKLADKRSFKCRELWCRGAVIRARRRIKVILSFQRWRGWDTVFLNLKSWGAKHRRLWGFQTLWNI